MTCRKPSSEIAATYSTSGEKTKFTEIKTHSQAACQSNLKARTNHASLRHLLMAHNILRDFIPVAQYLLSRDSMGEA
jgi:hypothetical protein